MSDGLHIVEKRMIFVYISPIVCVVIDMAGRMDNSLSVNLLPGG